VYCVDGTRVFDFEKWKKKQRIVLKFTDLYIHIVAEGQTNKLYVYFLQQQ